MSNLDTIPTPEQQQRQQQQQQQKTEGKDHGENNPILGSLADMDSREGCLC